MRILILSMAACILAGAAMAVQPALNTELARGTGSTLWAALISVLVSALLLGAIVSGLRLPLPSRSGLAGVEGWGWIGGAAGVVFICATLWSVGRLGLTGVVVLVVAGQFFAASLVDHYGFFHLTRRPIDVQRIAGLGLIAAGVVLTLRGH